MTSGGLTFLSWVRTGLISAVAAPSGASGSFLDANLPLSASLPVTFTLDGAGPASYQANIAGPGDVVGIDQNQVIRCEPVAGSMNMEPDYFPFIEFDRPDLPWMITPNAPATAGLADTDARRGLRPWLCLVVVTDREIAAPTKLKPLASVTVSDADLPDLETAWLWCHAQVMTAAGEDLQNLLTSHPERTLSRLIAPRRLQAATNYLACVVPTYESGRRAGLGLDPPATGPLAPAWTHGAAPRDIELPLYYSWRFSTSKISGDFESLARLMKALRFGESGVRPLDVGNAGSELPGPAAGAAAWTVELEGMIVGDQISPGAWPDAWRQRLQDAIALRLASSAQELAPPTYGSLQAGYKGALTGGQGPQWIRDLNLDPRYRATAALGTRTVQRYQEALASSAWKQSAAIREANRLLRQAQLARDASAMAHARIVDPARVSAGRLLQLTGAVHNQVKAGGSTVASALSANAAAQASVTVPFRRIARPAGPLAKRMTASPLADPVLRLSAAPGSSRALRPTPELRAVSGTMDLGQVAVAGSGESFGSLTPARVEQPVFPWEPLAPQAAPESVPIAYMSDLVVATRGPDNAAYVSASTGRALDFDGVPQLGWGNEARPIPFMPAVYIDRMGVQGTLSAYEQWDASKGCLVTSLRWQPGFLFEPAGAPVTGPALQGSPLAMAVADITETGRVDIAVIWEEGHTVVTGSGAGWTATETRWDTFLAVGLDLDLATGNLRGGWTDRLSLAADSRTPASPISLTASGSRLLCLSGAKLEIMTMSALQSGMGGGYGETLLWLSTVSVDLGGRLPADFVQGAIAAADFGGGTGADLLVYYVAGSADSLRAGYRIAYDLGTSMGYWGEMQASPVPVDGSIIALFLGVTSASADQLRTEKTSAFRAAAGATQARQQRIYGQSAPPPPAPAVDAQQLAGDVGSAIDPSVAVRASVAAQLELAATIDPRTVTDPLQPLALTPKFPYPMFELLKSDFPDRIYPGGSDLPDNCVTVLEANDSAIEAYFAGLNHEMSRLLLFRQFPVRHGTFFSAFWNAGRDEIAPIEGWDAHSALGTHAPAGVARPSLLLAVRAELLRRIPNVTIYASPAKAGSKPGTRTVDTTQRKDPLFSGRLDPDIRFFAFDLTAGQARGSGATDGWYFVFQQHPTAPRFGLDEASDGFGTKPADWSALAWPQVAATAADYQKLVYVNAGGGSPLAGVTLPDGGRSALRHKWGFSAAHMAHITLQRPVLVAIHGRDLIDKGVRP